ncbi:NAD(P)/FAD-dependent oxidoreductase [Falsiroseomonas sp. HW251]|uniref:NAD(P)/FAD-dependent oxidoreductase n=1 Tax=Falsiroseomonas sp. HW251 TaxID=3390998 RepID=UPI003D31889B
MPLQRVAIVGAGLAGLACARTLAAHGTEVSLLDKGRSPGGRLATRRVEQDGRAFSFDHGAQYLTARGPLFAATLDAAGARAWPEQGKRVGVPRMSAIARGLAEGLDMALGREVVALTGGPGAWMLRHVAARRPGSTAEDDAQESGPFQAVALAIPAAQAAALLARPAPHLGRVLEMVRFAPCWTLMAAFPDRLPLPDTLRPEDGPVGWAARDSSKPGRDHATECWVVQAGPAWSRENLELRPEQAQAALLDALGALAGAPLTAPLYAAAHRWRYALVETPLGAPCLWEPTRGLGAAGDWCIAARAEAAVQSGAALGAVMAR